MKKNQVFIGIGLIIAMIFFGRYLNVTKEGPVLLFLITGLILGYILTRSRYGFAGGVKRIWITGEGSLTMALLAMFAISIIGASAIHFGAAIKGAIPAFRAVEGDMVIPGSGFVAPTDLAVVVGGFIFGIGMMLGGGCASGTLTDSGEGHIRAWITVFFFAIGGIIGHGMLPALENTFLKQVSLGNVYLPDVFGGYLVTVLVSLLGLLVLYAITKSYESKRKNQGTYEALVFEDGEKPLESSKDFKFFSKETYHKFFVERWTFMTGGILIAMMFIFILNTTGSSWGASGPYTLWGVWLFEKFGVQFNSPAFEGVVKTVNNGLMNNPVHIRNIGIIFGSAIALLLAGSFKFDVDFKLKDILYYALGGILMGIGAKVGGGCNIGALYSGIANFSLSGWLFLVSIVFGGIFGLNIFQGKMNMIPNRK